MELHIAQILHSISGGFMKQLKKATLLIMFFTFLLTFSCISHAAKSENNSFENAQKIFLRNRFPFYQEKDNQTKYFYADINYDGSIMLSVDFPKKCDFSISLYNGNQQLLYKCTCQNDYYVESEQIGVLKGDKFYVVVQRKKAGSFYINFNFKECSWPKGNGSFEKALPLNVEDTIQGFARSGKDSDYYKITIPEPGYIYISYHRKSDYKNHNYIALYDENRTVLWKKDLLYEDQVKSPFFKVPKGLVYIKINGANRNIYRFQTRFSKASIKIPNIPKLLGLYAIKKGMKVAWNKPFGNVSGYQIQYTMDGNFKKGLKSVRINDPDATTANITGLLSSTTYFARIRSFYTVNGKTYYSHWSSGHGNVSTR